ncbi:MAG: hypothetical protein WCG01_00600 [bacterium]
MDFSVYKDKLPMSGHEILQRFGYAHITSYHTGKDSYAKRVSRDHFPRYHCYIKEIGNQITFSLHIDQKQASYQGQSAHAGEYDGPLVEAEINNLKNHIVNMIQQVSNAKAAKQIVKDEKKIPWWKFF